VYVRGDSPGAARSQEIARPLFQMVILTGRQLSGKRSGCRLVNWQPARLPFKGMACRGRHEDRCEIEFELFKQRHNPLFFD
jgi:hypothetical protein